MTGGASSSVFQMSPPRLTDHPPLFSLLPLQKLSWDCHSRVLDSVSCTFSGQNCLTIKLHVCALFARVTLLFLFDGTLLSIEKKLAGLQVSNEKCVIFFPSIVCMPQDNRLCCYCFFLICGWSMIPRDFKMKITDTLSFCFVWSWTVGCFQS